MPLIFAALLTTFPAQSGTYFQDPHPIRTMYRGPVLRLLDDPQTRLTLELDSKQSANLVEFLRELDRRQEELFAKTEDDLHARLEALRSKTEERQRSLLAEFERGVGAAAKRKLLGRAVHIWGDLAPFAVGVADEIGVTKDQRSKAEAAIRRSERQRGELSKENVKPEDFELVGKALSHDLDKLLTPEQKKKRDELAGPKPDWEPQLYVEKEAAREERESRPPATHLHRDPKRFSKLLQIEEALDLLKITGDKRREVSRWVRRKSAEDDELAILKKKDADTVRTRMDKLTAFDEAAEKELSELLGSEKWERAQQLRRQLAGVGAAFGVKLRKEIGVNDAQLHSTIEKLHQATERANAEDQNVADEAELRKRQTKRQQEFDALLLGSLTEDQRIKWRKSLGEPFDKNALSRISRRL